MLRKCCDVRNAGQLTVHTNLGKVFGQDEYLIKRNQGTLSDTSDTVHGKKIIKFTVDSTIPLAGQARALTHCAIKDLVTRPKNV